MIVSVCAINYNNTSWVLETLESIHNQTFKNFELIIVDDCSTDDSVGKIENWLNEKNNSNYTLIKNITNLGVSKTCNIAVKVAKGKYITLIATDDVMLENKLKVQVDFLKNTDEEVGAVYSDAILIDENSDILYGRFIQRHKPTLTKIPSGYIYNELIKANFIPIMSVMYKTRILNEIGYYDENLVYEDYDFLLRLSSKYKIVFSEYISVLYRVRKNSLSNTLPSSKEWKRSNVLIYLKQIDKHNDIINKLLNVYKTSLLNNDKELFYILHNNENFRKKVKIKYANSLLIKVPNLFIRRQLYRIFK